MANYEELKNCKTTAELINKLTGEKGKRVTIVGIRFISTAGVPLEIYQQAKSLKEQGYDVTILILRGGDMEPPRGVRLEYLGKLSKDWFLERIYGIVYPLNPIKLIKGLTKLRNCDVVICHVYPATIFGFLAKMFFGAKYIAWHYHVPETAHMSGLLRKIYAKLTEYLNEKSFIIKYADCICSISESSKEVLKRKTGLDSIVISIGTENERFSGIKIAPEDIEEVRKKYSIKDNHFVMLFVGRISPTKNIHSLIKVFRILRESVPNTQLIIVGAPTNKDYFNQLQKESDENVIFTGAVSDKELACFYSICDVFATCSLLEGRTLPPLEARRFGKVAIGFDVPGVRDVVEKEYLVPKGDYRAFADKIKEVLLSLT